MNIGYVYNYQDYEELIKSNFTDSSLVHKEDIPFDFRGHYVGVGLQVAKAEDGKYYFISNLRNVPYYKVKDLAVPRHIHDLLLIQAFNNKYIPVYSTEGELLFEEKDFISLRKKMAGLSEYDAGDFEFSDNLNLPGITELIKQMDDDRKNLLFTSPIVVERARNVIEQKMGLSQSAPTTEESYEIINTGSTGRGTNVPNDFDYDFAVRMELGKFCGYGFNNVSRLQQFFQSEFVVEPSNVKRVSSARLKLENIPVVYQNKDGEEVTENFDIDFSFFSNKKKFLSTVGALEQRLENIRIQDETRYKMVLANIVYAKKTLKDANAYKPYRSDNSQGGLGGVGIENWVLQNGGSFIDAAKSFVSVAQSCIEKYNVDLSLNYFDNDNTSPAYKAFTEFQSKYPVFDFGKSLEAVSKGNFPYDNFIMRNMRINGFLNTYKALNNHLEYLKEEGYVNDEKMSFSI